MVQLNTTGIGIGDYVETIHNHKGRVYDVHFGCPEGKGWQKMQTPKLTDDEITMIWFSVLVHNGGSVVFPATRVTAIPPFKLKNNWASEYWPREYSE